MKDKYGILKEYFGHTSFRPGQEEIVDCLLSGRDVLCVMPTGAGKSLCYQVPALATDGITLVVSPLISLMKDQVAALLQAGVAGAYLNSALNDAQYAKALGFFRQGRYKIVYVAPERLLTPAFLQACQSLPISLLAIDEAHCVSQWGQDFRPSYLKIASFIEALPKRPTVGAFTATATETVREDILRLLSLQNPLPVSTGFDRQNLFFSVERPAQKTARLLELVRKYRDRSGIVYCATRKAVEEVAAMLSAAGISATRYHAGLSPEERHANQEDFAFDRKTVMVATNAFGMGIDKSNVSFVIHYNMPKNMESYYQEAGRAGRDGEEADCILLYAPRDVHTNEFLIKNGEPNPELTEEEQRRVRRGELDKLKQMTFYSTTTDCLRGFILRYFGEKAPVFCGKCGNCLHAFVPTDITAVARGILAAVAETGGRYGKKTVTDILRGSANERIRTAGLDSLPCYGSLSALSEIRLRRILERLCEEGLLDTEGEDYPVLRQTAAGVRFLAGDEKLIVRLPKEAAPGKPAKATAAPAGTADGALLAALKALRKKLADRQGVPAYVIFSDATLLEMAAVKPLSPAALLEISGVGQKKCDRYGAAFLAVIADFPGKPE